MSSSSARSSNQLAVPSQPRQKRNIPFDSTVCRELVAHSKTKTSLLSTLQTLGSAGLLKGHDGDADSAGALKRTLADANTMHADTLTPYGPIVQKIELGHSKLQTWEYINPFAYLYYLSSISSAFAEMMRSVCVDGRPLRIVVYADGLVPGNPFRPEASRKLCCIYWCIVDWPQHVLQRSFAWPIFSILRESIIQEIEGGLGRIMRILLRTFFFNPDGHSFLRGVHINCPSGDFAVTGVFAGFLADLLGHKELTEWKGTGGTLCCLTCHNVINMQHRKPRRGEVATNCSNPELFKKRTNESLYKSLETIKAKHEELSAKPKFPHSAWDSFTSAQGFNYVPEGLMYDVELREIYHPVDHCIRDWQHTFCQDGIANTHIAYVLHRCNLVCGLKIGVVQEFSQICHYPSWQGKLDKNAFGSNRLKHNTIASFSSVCLTMVAVLYLFMDKFVAERLPEEFEAFKLLYHILGIFRLGPEDAMDHIDTLNTLLREHLDKVVKLYDEHVKPKGHHAFHIVDGMLWLGKLLSCFVTERKHKEVKSAAVHIFRHIEHTVLTDLVNKTFEQLSRGDDIYMQSFLVRPRCVRVADSNLRRSNVAVLRLGRVSAGDVTMNSNGDVGMVTAMWQGIPASSTIYAEVEEYPTINDDLRFRSVTRSTQQFWDASTLIDTIIWVEESPGIIRIAIPPGILYRKRA